MLHKALFLKPYFIDILVGFSNNFLDPYPTLYSSVLRTGFLPSAAPDTILTTILTARPSTVRNWIIGLLAPLVCLSPCVAEEVTGLIPAPIVTAHDVRQVFEYRCGPNTECEVRCSMGEGFDRFAYQNVRRLELARGADVVIVGAVYIDPVGKGHTATGILPQPAACILDDLDLIATIPVVDGGLNRPSDPGEVIFDVQPLD